MMVRYLSFNFAGLFDFGCFSQAQEMSFVIRYLPSFREWLYHPLLLAFLPFQHLFTDSLRRSAPCSLLLPLSLVHVR
jgi:hypothetical protein